MKLTQVISGLTLAWLVSGSAHAIPTAWTATFDPPDIRLTADAAVPARSVNFSLDIREGVDGFRPGVDFIDTALLTVLLYDDLDLTREQVSFSFDGTGWTTPEEVDGLPFLPQLFIFSPLELLNDGVLDVMLTATRGDFLFDQAFLVAIGERVDVAEPAAILLFGMGLIGIAFVARRRTGLASRRRAR
jgi:hypothetical protein